MHLKGIPIDELIIHFNQIDLFSLILCSKLFYNTFRIYLERLKKWIDARCNNFYISYSYVMMHNKVLYIYDLSYNSIEKTDRFTLPTIINVEKIIKIIIERDKILIKNGDLIKGSGSNFKKPWNFCKYYMNGEIFNICFNSFSARYSSFKFIEISPFYWANNLKYDQLIIVKANEYKDGIDIDSSVGPKYFMPRKNSFQYGETISRFYKTFEDSYIIYVEKCLSTK